MQTPAVGLSPDPLCGTGHGASNSIKIGVARLGRLPRDNRCYLFEPVLRALEPYALDLWNHEITEWLSEDFPGDHIHKRNYYGGLYQEVIVPVPACT